MAIKTKKLTVAEICKLNVELNAEKGLLSERLPMVFKYHLSKVAETAATEQAAVNKLRDEAITAAGTKNEQGGFKIEQFITIENKKKGNSKVENPAYTNFVGEMEALFSQEKEITYEEFYIDDLKNVESAGTYPVFFKLLEA